MLIRLVFASQNNRLEKYFEKNYAQTDIQVLCVEPHPNAWQKLVRSCGDIIVVNQNLIPHPIESGIAILNELPEKPTTVILHDSDSSEDHAQLVTAGADVVLYMGIKFKSLVEAIETTLESRRKLILMEQYDKKRET